ncbi:MAG: type II toxin-antitoxin system PemK/MazF family toxin [Candidatus Methylomirabilota bacterium]
MTRGTVVLTPFPFTDLHGAKVRPAIILSRTDRSGDDVIFAFVSSVVPAQPLPTDLSVDPDAPEGRDTGLKRPSVIRCDKLATVQRRVLLGELGSLSVACLLGMDRRLKHALALS